MTRRIGFRGPKNLAHNTTTTLMPDSGFKIVKTFFARKSSKEIPVDLPVVEEDAVDSTQHGRAFDRRNYSIVTRLGRGSFGHVDLVRSNGNLYALKSQKTRQPAFGGEIDAHLLVCQRGDHQNIVKLHYASGNDNKTGLIAMEYCDGMSLSRLTTLLSEDQLRPIARQVVSGLMFLHSIGIIHRDVKPENLILCRDGTVKIIDLGVAHNTNTSSPTSASGTLLYMSPEQITCMDHPLSYGDKVDCWAMGVSLVELALGKLPNAHLPKHEAVAIIKKGDPPTLGRMKRTHNIDREFSVDFQEFILSCLKRSPHERASAVELSRHRWLTMQDEDGVTQSLVDIVNEGLRRRDSHTKK
ncbi:serine/threonine-protein kinase 10-like [Planoprotostelium fungivorum]|uniref:Serine/threonine-protein kinase 10-like n=1 Tax=Planoprotostelium fungivorum TaxID=1890364 RepID=A0A2P6NY42_9EUKA|nr:serine/threonine-protein kinase 10-like [Planoprotostelium fungivorum]